LSITVPRGRYKDLQASTNIQQPVVAPVAKGSELGEVEIRLGDEVVATRMLVAVDEVEKGSWWRRILDSLLMLIWG
jgi:D-alanyl-D-alanine carboxypeptidase (penicillin-binding protein 5/6)